MAERLTQAQRAAIDLLRACDDYDDGWGVVGNNAGSETIDGQPWINWRTAYSLERRGIVEITSWVDGAIIRLRERPGAKEAGR